MALFSMAEQINDNRSKRETMSIEKATVSNMWEIATIVEVLGEKSMCTALLLAGLTLVSNSSIMAKGKTWQDHRNGTAGGKENDALTRKRLNAFS